MEHRISALLQLNFHSRLNAWLQWIGQRQLTATLDEKHLSFEIWCVLHMSFDGKFTSVHGVRLWFVIAWHRYVTFSRPLHVHNMTAHSNKYHSNYHWGTADIINMSGRWFYSYHEHRCCCWSRWHCVISNLMSWKYQDVELLFNY